MAERHEDDRIEELLSQLQGIFGKLSHSEQQESGQKTDPSATPAPPAAEKPTTPPVEPVQPPAAAPPTTPVEPPLPPPTEPVFEAVPFEPPAQTTAPQEPPAPPPSEPPPPPNPEPSLEPAFAAPSAESTGAVIYTALFYPPGRDEQAKVLASKLQTMTPKFTKVTFQLNVTATVPYDPKMEWQESVLASLGSSTVRALFMISDRPMDDSKRKVIITELESRGIYFQEVPITSIEKKAFYTDLLLGMVFFFDSQKPMGGPA